MNWLYSNDLVAIATVVSGVTSVVTLVLQWSDRRAGAPSNSFQSKQGLLSKITASVFVIGAVLWSSTGWSPSRGKDFEQTAAVSIANQQPTLPVRARLEVLAVEVSPPIKSALVQIKAFIGDDTIFFPSAGTRNWLPVSGTFNDQSAMFFTNPRLTIQFELELADGQSSQQATLLSSERVSYKGGEVRAFYTLDGPDPTASNASGIRKAIITYRLQPAS